MTMGDRIWVFMVGLLIMGVVESEALYFFAAVVCALAGAMADHIEGEK